MKKFIRPLIYSIVFMLVLTFIITLLNYINLISGLPLRIIKVIIPIISFLIAGFMVGKNSLKKGWLSGIEIGIILTVIFIIVNLLLKEKITIYLILYYSGLIIVSTLGSMFGINKKAS